MAVYYNIYIPSATTLKPLTDEVNHTNYSLAVAPVSGWYTLSSCQEVDVFEAGKVGECTDLSDSDKNQTVMARPLYQNISRTAGVVGCSWSAAVTV